MITRLCPLQILPHLAPEAAHEEAPTKSTMLLLLLLLFLSPPFTLSLTQDGLFLHQVKLQLSDPDNALSNWNLRDATPCNWFGVTCDTHSGDVTSLNLPNAQLQGPFPTILCRLPSLTVISFYNNLINSSLPADISDCRHLQFLNLSQNALVGPIPDTLSQISGLRHLDLSFNNLSGDIPASFGQFQRLESLELVMNLLNGTVPSYLGNISSLRVLRLAYNPFAPSPIPVEFGNLKNIEELWLTYCNLVGPIPASLGRLTRLWNLDFSMNRLNGSIPESIVGIRSLVQLELYQNSLSGKIPVGMSKLTNLRRFDASTNMLTGTIPDELCRLELESLNLDDNQLVGPLPESIALSPNLQELKLFNNTLTGKLPSALGNNSKLMVLDVSYNQFYDEIPETLCEGGELVALILIYNSFSGKIPQSLGECTSLNRVRMRNNNLSGIVPDSLWGLPHMYLLELLHNSLSGQISSKISGARNLSQLLISNNQFSDSIPDEIGSLNNLVEFDGSHNTFSSQIPASIVKLSQLGRLDLSDNKLSGAIPEEIDELNKLSELNLAKNMLDGNIPKEIGSLPLLNYLDLSGNQLCCEIPPQLQNLKLNSLNLSYNHLSGNIPFLYDNENYRKGFIGNQGLCGNLYGLCPHYGESKNRRYLWLFLSIFVLAGIAFVVGVAWFYFKYRSFKKLRNGFNVSKWRSFHRYGFSELEIVKLLSEDNVIGSGASGKVYKVALSNGEIVAVKKLWRANNKEDGSVGPEKDEFEVEVETLGKIRHMNIVRLWCCCNTGDSKLLVYEYMPNGSLADILHSSKKSLLDWPTRYKIAIDAAEGLSYLHHDCVPPIAHRDVKSNNILLDGEFGAKVADFGVAKMLREGGQGGGSMSVIAGSYGYIAPEYAYTLRVNEKSDIYSFGVVILELVTGKPPIDLHYGEDDLVKWVSKTLKEKGIEQVIDPCLDSKYEEQISKVLSIGLLCTSCLPITRPSIRRVVKMLQEVSADPKSRSTVKRDGKLSPYYPEETGDHESTV